MSKYIIDTGNYLFTTDGVLVVGFDCDNKLDTCYEPLSDLEELNSDYINEHYGELQDEAYQRGFEDGKKSVSDPDRIEVGDEVIWSDGSTIIVTMVYVDGGSEWCDGVNQNGRAYHVLLENVRKTGKHYDIASILEAMRI